MEKNFEQERKALKVRVTELERKLEGATRDVAVAESNVETREADLAALHNNLKELEELREMKEVTSCMGLFISSVLLLHENRLLPRINFHSYMFHKIY